MKNIFREKRVLGAKNSVRLFFDKSLTWFVIKIIVIIFCIACLGIFLWGNTSMKLSEAQEGDSSAISGEHTESSQQAEPDVRKDPKLNLSQSKDYNRNTSISKKTEESSEIYDIEEVTESNEEEEASENYEEEEVSENHEEEEVSENHEEEEVSENHEEEEVSENHEEEEVSENHEEEEVSENYEEEEVSENHEEEEVSNNYEEESAKRVDAHIIKGINGICQFPELPTGCEATALTCLMNFWGIDVGKVELAMNYMPREEFFYKGEILYGSNPNNVFAGDPSSEDGIGCFADCLVLTFKNYVGANQKLKGKYLALDLDGKSFECILQEYVANDIPVVVIVSPFLREPYESFSWKLKNGGTWTWQTGHHAMVVYGFDMAKNEVYVADSAVQSGIAVYPLTRFIEIYDAKGRSAMTILQQ